MNTNVYPELFDRVVRADAIFEYNNNEIVELAYGTYQDYNPKSEYYFFKNKKSFQRKREEVIFEAEDMKKLVSSRVQKWCQNRMNIYKTVIRSCEEVVDGGYAMMIVPDEECPKIIPVEFVLGRSYRKPCQLVSEGRCQEAYSSDLSDLTKLVYFFNEEDIEQLANDFEICTRVK